MIARLLLSILVLLMAAGCPPALAEDVAPDAPPKLLKKLQRKTAQASSPGKKYDKPREAQEFFAAKRLPPGERVLPLERYVEALRHMRGMPRHSTRHGALQAPPTAPETTGPAPLAQSASASLGAWTALGPGNIGGRTRALLIDPASPSTMYAAGVAGGVWKTLDGGASWTPLTDLLANLSVTTLAADPGLPGVLYAGTGEGFFNIDSVRGAGIWKSADAGASWAQLAATNTSDFWFVNRLVVSPANGQRLYAATRTGVWRSLNGGGVWTRVLDPAVMGGCLDLAIRTDQSADYVFAACGTFAQGTVYRNVDAAGAGTWTSVLTEAGMGRSALAIAPSNQDVVYVLAASVAGGTFNDGLHAVFRSTTGGAPGTFIPRVRNTSPTKLNTVLLTNTPFAFYADCGFFPPGPNQYFNQGWYDAAIAVDPVNADRVWVGGIDLFRSDDGGANWGLASYWWDNGPTYVHSDQHAIVFHPQYDGTTNRTLFVAGDGGLFRTTDALAATATGAAAPCNPANASVTWTELNNGYGVTQFYHGVPYPSGATYFGGTQDNGTVRGTDPAGPDGWTEILGGDGGYVAVDPGNPSVLYAENTGKSIQKSTDGGQSWFGATSGITESAGHFLFITPFAMDPGNAQRLWTGGWFLWRTTNGAGSWTQAGAVTVGNGSVSAVGVAKTDGNRVLAGMSDGFIHRTSIGLTSNSGTGWPVTQPRAGYVSWVTFDPTNANVAYATYSTFGGTHVWKSLDAGATWSGIDGSGPTAIPDVPVHVVVVDPTDPARLYVGTDVGVFVSRDGGGSWAVENTGFANVVTEALAVGDVAGVPNLFAFTHGRGAWRVATADAVTRDLVIEAPGLSAGSVAAGGTVTVTYDVKNQGTGTVTETYTERVYLSTDQALGAPPDVLLGTSAGHAADLGPGATAPQAFQVTIPAGTAPGPYVILVQADALGAVTESNETNNVAGVAITVTSSAPPVEVIVDNLPAGQQDAARTYTGSWCKSTQAGFFGADSVYGCGGGTDTYRWTPTLQGATYQVFARWTANVNRSTSVPYVINHASGQATVAVSQRVNGGQWNLLGTFTFAAGNGGWVQVSDVNGPQASADAVRFTPTGGPPPPTVTIAATTGTVPEAGPGTGVFTVTRTGATTAALAVSYTVGGTATAGGDYQALPGNVTIPIGASSAPIPVSPMTDQLAEGDETVVVTLAANAAYVIGSPAGATVTIVDDDGPPPPSEAVVDNLPQGQQDAARTFTGSWCTSSQAGFFGVGSLYGCGSSTDLYRWTPTLSAGTYDVYAWWTANVNRTSAAQYRINHGAGQAIVVVDQKVNGGKWNLLGQYPFAATGGWVELSDPSGPQASADAVRFVPATGPGLPLVTVVATTATVPESGPGTGAFTVTRTGATTAALVVSYTVNGTATAGTDYTTLPGTVTIPVGQPSADVVVTPMPDGAGEGSETVVLTLAANAAYTVGSPSAATVTILDDDGPPPPVEVIVDNLPAGQQDAARTYTGSWCKSTQAGFFGADSVYGCGGETDTYRWTPTLQGVTYQVFARWTANANRSTSVPYVINHASGQATVAVSQRVNGGQWNLLGTFTFAAGNGGWVQVSDVNGPQASADAVRFVPVP